MKYFVFTLDQKNIICVFIYENNYVMKLRKKNNDVNKEYMWLLSARSNDKANYDRYCKKNLHC